MIGVTIINQSYSSGMSVNIPISMKMARSTINTRLKAKIWKLGNLLMLIMRQGTPPSVLPSVSKMLNSPRMSRLNQSGESMNEIGYAVRIPGSTK